MKISRTVRRRGLVAAVILAVFTITGFFILPPIVKSQLEKRLSAELGRRVSVEKVRLNPYTLSLTLENFAIQEQDGTTRFLGWRRLYVNFNALASIWGEWVLSDVELDGFTARGVINPDQTLNVSDLLAKLAPPNKPAADKAAPEKPGRPIRVSRLRVTDARIDVSDRSRRQPFDSTIGPLTFDLANFRTVTEKGAPYRFSAVTEAGEKLAWSGTIRAEPFASAGELSVENIVLAKYAPYYADRISADIKDGKLSVRGRYELDLTPNHQVMKFEQGAVQLRGLAVRERGTDQDAVELPSLDVSGIEADALAMKAAVASVSVDGGHVRARRAKDGAINLLTMLQPSGPPPAAAAAAAPTPPAKLPDIMVGEVAVKNLQVEVADLAAARPAQLALNGIQLSLKKVTLAEGAQMPLQLSFAWAPQGTVRIEGNIGIFPVMADLKVEAADVATLPLSPYIEQFANVHLTQGAVTASLMAKASQPAGKPLAASVTGDVKVDKFGVVDAAHNEELAGFTSVAVRGIHAATGPELTASVEEINIAGPYARVIVNADKTMNLMLVQKATPAAAAPMKSTPATPPAPAAPQPKIEIAKVVVSDGDFRFTDHSVTPAASMAVGQFGGTITGLSSTNPAKADVNLKALVDGAGPVAIVGKLDPLGPKMAVDLKVDAKNVDLVPLSPYTGKFAGYELARGKLVVDTKLQVDGKEIDSANVITLNQFTFGAPVQSPDATKLPVRLGVALLKDLDGKIVIDIPVQGSTDDPEFKVGRVVMRVIVNLLTKAAVSPFSLLGAAFGGGGEELSYQEFAPGSPELLPTETKKLETLVKALTNRPGLSLDIEGSYDTAADAYALKRSKLADQVRRAIWDAKHQKDPNIPPPEQLVISPEENAAMVKTLFDQAFPPGTEFGTPLPPAPAVVAPPPAPAPGFFRRMLNAMGIRSSEERKAAEEKTKLAAEHEKAVAAAIATGLPLDEMMGRLAEKITVDDNELRALAQARAQKVRDYLAGVGKIAPERLFLANKPQAPAKEGKGPRVFLQLQ